MADIVIGVRAYAKMLLHAMKYPHHSVNGIFLAEKRRNKEHNSGPVNIVDCIPLFHLSLSLTPMLEVAMMQVDQYCKDHSLVIAGYYQANEHVKDTSPDSIAYRIAEKIYENFVDACLVMLGSRISFAGDEDRSAMWCTICKKHPKITNPNSDFILESGVTSSAIHLKSVDNQKMSLDCDDVAFHLYQFTENKWKLKDKNSIHFEQGHKALSCTSALLHSKTYRKLNDFDNHLDDISLDWSNQVINEEIDRCL